VVRRFVALGGVAFLVKRCIQKVVTGRGRSACNTIYPRGSGIEKTRHVLVLGASANVAHDPMSGSSLSNTKPGFHILAIRRAVRVAAGR